MKIIKRLFGIILITLFMALGTLIFLIILILFGEDKANCFLDKLISLPFFKWIEQ